MRLACARLGTRGRTGHLPEYSDPIVRGKRYLTENRHTHHPLPGYFAINTWRIVGFRIVIDEPSGQVTVMVSMVVAVPRPKWAIGSI